MDWLRNFLRKLFSIREQSSDGDIVKPFLDHLEDLRVVIFKMIASLACGSIVAFCYRNKLMALAKAPLPSNIHLKSFVLGEPFMMSLKLALYAGVVISFPALLWFLAGFILPALTRQEKKLLIPGISGGFALFACGVVGAYKFILPKAIDFFFNYNQDMHIDTTELTVGQYISFVANMLLACGLLCEGPVVVLVLAKLGLVSFKLLSKTRPFAVVGLLIVVALIAPSPDPFTFITLSLPALAVYELCIWIVWLMERRRSQAEEGK